jgi:hypothetical protein
MLLKRPLECFRCQIIFSGSLAGLLWRDLREWLETLEWHAPAVPRVRVRLRVSGPIAEAVYRAIWQPGTPVAAESEMGTASMCRLRISEQR